MKLLAMNAHKLASFDFLFLLSLVCNCPFANGRTTDSSLRTRDVQHVRVVLQGWKLIIRASYLALN